MEKIRRVPMAGMDAPVKLAKLPGNMGSDPSDKRWIVAKGMLFLILALLGGGLQLVANSPLWQESMLLIVCVWAGCRFYYSLFHRLHACVDPGLPGAGMMDLVVSLGRRR